MQQRIDMFAKGQNVMKAMYGLNSYLEKSVIEDSLLDLVYFRVSQINGCAFCLDMHSKDMRIAGETEQRLYTINAWRETPFFNDRERAALAYAEALTKATAPDDVYNEVCKHFSEQEVIDLTVAIVTINSYNRLNIAFRPLVGTYVPGQFATAK